MDGTIPELKSAAQIVSELEGQADKAEDENIDPREAKEYTFDFSYTDARGKTWAGKFTNRILTIRQRRQVKVMKAQLSGGLSVASLDADVWEMNEMIAHLSVSLAKPVPEWARDLEALFDEQIVIKLYEEVALHEATFHGRDAADSASARSVEDGAG